MDVLIRRAEPASRPSGLLAVGVPEGPLTNASPAARLDRLSRGAVKALFASGDFSGRAGETALLWLPGTRARRVLLDLRGELLKPALGLLAVRCVLEPHHDHVREHR